MFSFLSPLIFVCVFLFVYVYIFIFAAAAYLFCLQTRFRPEAKRDCPFTLTFLRGKCVPPLHICFACKRGFAPKQNETVCLRSLSCEGNACRRCISVLPANEVSPRSKTRLSVYAHFPAREMRAAAAALSISMRACSVTGRTLLKAVIAFCAAIATAACIVPCGHSLMMLCAGFHISPT